MPSSSTQAACSSSSSFSDYAEAFAQYVRRLVQTLRPVVEAAARSAAGYCARLLIGQVLRSAENTARTILRKLARRPIQNEEIAVSSPQGAAVLSNPKCRDSPVQLLEEIARGCGHSDASSLALKLCFDFMFTCGLIGIDEVKSIMTMPNLWQICTPRPEITDWERGDRIGKGSFGSVYKGYSKEHKLFFAAKGVPLDDHGHICHLENEIAILKGLHHDNIIQFYGTERVRAPLNVNESQVSDYTRQILQGLRYLHSSKVVHGDLKCANILVTESGRVKLADFGLSRSMEDHSQSLKLGLGSSYWMAPEVANPKRVGYGFPSDIWSLGCTVTELSTRKYPQYNARNAVSLDRAIRGGKGPIVPDYLSDTLKDFINQCLQPDPKQRPTAAELLAHPFDFINQCLQPDPNQRPTAADLLAHPFILIHLIPTHQNPRNSSLNSPKLPSIGFSILGVSVGVEERIDIAESTIGNELLEQEGDGMVVEPHDGMEFESEDAAKIFFDE
uniref:mitogen-activated protein kinase kinase kinase n=1 Tax=Salix viminalis TaxID=40686 RepID=A0A6N2MX91_SALVM